MVMAKTPTDPPTRIRKILAVNMKRLRAEREYTQEDLAFEAGLDRSYIAHVERLKRNPSLDNVAKIAKALGVEVYELLRPILRK
jgi:transcriptional regulator with XRE-family HTH domain